MYVKPVLLTRKPLTLPSLQPRLFPRRLPPNTLIFKVSNTDEYLTARLPAFLLADAQDEAEEGAGARHSTGNMIEDEEGNVSDPGPPSSSSLSVTTRRREDASLMLRRDATRVREAMLAKRKAILDRSLRETRMVQSVDDAELAKIISMEQEMKCLRMEVTRMRCRVDELLQDESFVKHREHSDRVLSLEQYARDKTAVEEERTARALRCQNRRQHLNERRNRLQQARERLDRQNRRLEVSMANHHLDLEVYRSISLSASQQRAGLISELSTIFPIELVDPTHVLFSICELPLPNGDFEGQQQAQRRLKHDLDDDHISSALGFVAQVVQLLAAYLTVPLYYPIRCMGSRSLVQDPISQMKGPKIFPLYSKGVDKYRFEYAVFLLNKDIEQVMLEYNIGLMDLAQTLPNLKNIYLTLSSDASTRCAMSHLRFR